MVNLDKFKAYEPVDKKTPRTYSDNYNKERKEHKKRCKEVEKLLTIQPRDIYDMYIEELDHELVLIKEKEIELSRSKTYTLNRLAKYKEFIETQTSFSFDEVLSAKTVASINNIISTDSKKLEHLKAIWGAFLHVKKELGKLDKLRADNKRKRINYRLWHKTVKAFNEKIIDKMIHEGYEFRMGYGLSSLRVQRQIRESPEIDNPTSFQNRKRIIEEGGTPHHPTDAPDGERWKVYRTERNKPIWYWAKKFVTIPNKTAYCWKPTGGTRGIIKMLYNHVEQFPNQIIKYGI